MSTIDRVAVLGAGTMGRGIAQVAAMAGARVRLRDLEQGILDDAVAAVRRNLADGIERGKVTEDAQEAILRRLGTTTDLEVAVRDADLVVEAVPEALNLKRKVLEETEAHAPDDALLATNTSSLRIGEIAQVLQRPGRFLGMHFFNPVHVMKLVEVVRGPATGEDAVETALAYVEHLGKEPIVVQDSPGFATSRLGVALGLEAIRMVEEEVATPEAIDKAMTLGYRHPMGPLRLTDHVGLDTRLRIATYLHEELGDVFEPPTLLREMVEAGKLGRKTGEGFYTWEE